MKFNKAFIGLALSAIVGGSLVSCSNEFDNYNLEQKGHSMLAKAPKMVAYSHDHFWDAYGTTRASGASEDGLVTWEDVNFYFTNFDEEASYVDKRLPEKNGNFEGLDEDFIYYAEQAVEVDLAPIFGQSSTRHQIGVFYYDSKGELHKVDLWGTTGNPESGLYFFYGNWMEGVHKKGDWVNGSKIESDMVDGKRVYIPANTYFGFYLNGNTNDEKTIYYSSSTLNEEVYCTDGGGKKLEGEPTSKIHAVTWNANGKTYLGFEDWTDMDFQDLVFAITPELSSRDATTFDPTNPTTPPTPPTPDDCECDHCDKDKGCNCEGGCTCGPEGNCPGCKEEGGNGGGTNTPDQPDQPEQPEQPGKPAVPADEVEINLALQDKHEQYDEEDPESHLSIHVRTAVNVEVFIPIEHQYLCDADDLEIILKKEQGIFLHGGPLEATYVIGDAENPVGIVTLNMAFVKEPEEGIRIWTTGITQEVIDYCYENYGDGITFEIWNYFDNKTLKELGGDARAALKEMLDQATVKFYDKDGNETTPDAYINAFGKDNGKYDPETNPDGKDFHVKPANEDVYDEPYEGKHFNGSDNNDIYVKKGADAPADEDNA